MFEQKGHILHPTIRLHLGGCNNWSQSHVVSWHKHQMITSSPWWDGKKSSGCLLSCAPRSHKLYIISPLCEDIFMPWLFYTHAIFQTPITASRTPENILLSFPAQESRNLPTKLAHPCESDTPIKVIESPTVGLRETHLYKDRAFQAVPHQDSKWIGVMCCTIALVWMHTEAQEGEEQTERRKLCNLLFVSQWLWISYLMKQ